MYYEGLLMRTTLRHAGDVDSVFCLICTPFPQIDIIGAMVIVWRVRGKIIRSLLCNSCAQCNTHTYEQT